MIVPAFSAIKTRVESELASCGVGQSSIRQWLLLNLFVGDRNRLSWMFNLKTLSNVFERDLTLVPPELIKRLLVILE